MREEKCLDRFFFHTTVIAISNKCVDSCNYSYKILQLHPQSNNKKISLVMKMIAIISNLHA